MPRRGFLALAFVVLFGVGEALAQGRDMVARGGRALQKRGGGPPLTLTAPRSSKGRGALAYWNGHLIVVQSPRGHEKIDELLRGLRASRR